MDFTTHPLKTAVTAGSKERLNTAVTAVRGERFKEADELFATLPDLVEDRYRAWYCQRFHKLGRDCVLKFASQARADGFNKRRLFSYLLKNGR